MRKKGVLRLIPAIFKINKGCYSLIHKKENKDKYVTAITIKCKTKYFKAPFVYSKDREAFN